MPAGYRETSDYNPDRHLYNSAFAWIAFGVVVLLVLGIVGFVGGWIAVPGRVLGPQNVQQQWRFAYQHYEALGAAAGNVCTAERSLAATTDPNERTQRSTQLAGYEQVYRSTEASYNAAVRNAFEAGLVKPPDLPDRAPTLTQSKAGRC